MAMCLWPGKAIKLAPMISMGGSSLPNGTALGNEFLVNQITDNIREIRQLRV